MGKHYNQITEAFEDGRYREEPRHNSRFANRDTTMKIYLAIPYTFNPALSHKIANKVAADLMKQGHIVFSPISHSHHVADHLPALLRTDSDWWMTQDLPFVEWADEMHLVCIGEYGTDLIEKSKGVQAEIAHARKHNKTIKIIEYYDKGRDQSGNNGAAVQPGQAALGADALPEHDPDDPGAGIWRF